MGVEHERQDGAEFFMKGQAELAVMVKTLVTGSKYLTALVLGLAAFNPFGSVDEVIGRLGEIWKTLSTSSSSAGD